MNNVNYKYNIGDTIKFKDKVNSSASCSLKKLAGSVVKVINRRYYGKPCYMFEGLEQEGWFTEGCLTAVSSNPYVIFVGDTKDDLSPYKSVSNKKLAVKTAKELATEYRCVEAIYMPEDNDDINDIVYSNYVEE